MKIEKKLTSGVTVQSVAIDGEWLHRGKGGTIEARSEQIADAPLSDLEGVTFAITPPKHVVLLGPIGKSDSLVVASVCACCNCLASWSISEPRYFETLGALIRKEASSNSDITSCEVEPDEERGIVVCIAKVNGVTCGDIIRQVEGLFESALRRMKNLDDAVAAVIEQEIKA
jgi:hypothetical protein